MRHGGAGVAELSGHSVLSATWLSVRLSLDLSQARLQVAL